MTDEEEAAVTAPLLLGGTPAQFSVIVTAPGALRKPATLTAWTRRKLSLLGCQCQAGSDKAKIWKGRYMAAALVMTGLTVLVVSMYLLLRPADRKMDLPLMTFSHLEYIDGETIRMQWLAPSMASTEPLLRCTSLGSTTSSQVRCLHTDQDGSIVIGAESFHIYHADFHSAGMQSCDVSICILEDCGPWKTIRLAAQDPTVTRVGFISDSHGEIDVMRPLIQTLVDWDVSMLLNGGDFVAYDGRRMDQWALDFLTGLNPNVVFSDGRPAVPLSMVRGNHDGESSLAHLMVFAGGQGEPWRGFRYGNIFFLLLNTNFGLAYQDDFIRSAMQSPEAQTSPFRVVVFHKPPFSNGWPYFGGEEHARSNWVPLFEQHDVDLVLGGHTHYFEAGNLNEVWYVVAGGAGGMLDEEVAPGTRLRYGFLNHLEHRHHALFIEATAGMLSCQALGWDDENRIQPFYEFQVVSKRKLPPLL